MSAGTINLTNNSKLVEGGGTSFITDLSAGDFVVSVVGGITYTLAIESIESDASLTLVKPYTGPTNSANAWNAVPRSTVSAITAEVVAQVTEALRGLNADKRNWQLVLSSDGNITVKLPDGSEFTGPSWKSIAEEQAKFAVTETGSKLIKAADAADAREIIGSASDEDLTTLFNQLGSAAFKNTGTSGDAVPLLNAANTWSGQQTFTTYPVVSVTSYPNIYFRNESIPVGTIGREVGFEVYPTNNGMPVIWRRISRTEQTGQTVLYFPVQSGTLALATSDEKLKDKVELVDSGYFERLQKLEVWHYKWNELSGMQAEQREIERRGFMAQQLNDVDTHYTIKPMDENQFWSVDDRAIIADLVLAVNALKKEIEELKSK